MRRREFITLLSGSATLWPCVSRAQERNHHPKIGVILNYSETDPEGKSRFSALKEQLGKLGWADANNVEIEVRWAAGKTDLRAAGYVDRLLRGEKPSDLPVQAPTKYELIVNMKAAKELDLKVPATLLATADEVLE